MKRSEINRYVREALDFLAEHRFALPEWATWTPAMWADCGDTCREIRDNALGWDVTDFGKVIHHRFIGIQFRAVLIEISH